jgi:Zn-dependent peptidase ImmA (M78 family)/DNA-binding XRE family transcriptional regulator
MGSVNASFNGERLKAARQYNAMTINDVAKETGLSSQAISQFENNKVEPKLETVLKLIGLLGFPRRYFYESDQDDFTIGDTYFRSLASTSKKDRVAQIERVKLLAQIYLVIDKYIRFPEYNLKIDSLKLDSLNVEEIAKAVREEWDLGDGPIFNIIDVMEKYGIVVASTFTNGNDIDAYSQVEIINKRIIPIVVLGSDKESQYRRQFSAAHELGHIIMDDLFTVDDLSKLEHKEMETLMHQFAGALLIPRKAFMKDLDTKLKTDIKLYIELKKKYRVSAAALIVRANQIDAISNNQYQYLMKQLSQSGYRTIEPFDKDTPICKPRYLQHAVKMMIDEIGISGDEFMDELSDSNLTIYKDMVESLVGLENGYLSAGTNEQAITLKSR